MPDDTSSQTPGYLETYLEGLRGQGIPGLATAPLNLLMQIAQPFSGASREDVSKATGALNRVISQNLGRVIPGLMPSGQGPTDVSHEIPYTMGALAPAMAVPEALMPTGAGSKMAEAAKRLFNIGVTPIRSLEPATMITGGGEIGRQIGERLGDEEKGAELGYMAGGLGTVPVSAATRVALEKGGGLVPRAKAAYERRLSPEGRKKTEEEYRESVKTAEEQKLREAAEAEPNLDQFLTEAQFAEESIPGFVNSLVSRTGSQSILDLKNELERRSVDFSKKGKTREAANARAVNDFIDANFPKSDLSLHSLASEAQTQRFEQLRAVEQDLRNQLSATKASLLQNPANKELGDRVRNIMAELEKTHRKISDENYSTVYKLGEGLQIDTQPMMSFLVKLRGADEEMYTALPKVFSDMAKGLQAGGEQQSIEALHSALRQLNEWRRQNPGTDSANRRRLVNEFKNVINDSIKNAGPQGQVVSEMLARADAFHRDLSDRFLRGEAGRVQYDRDRFGLSIQGRNVVKRFLEGGSEGAASWKRAVELGDLSADVSPDMLRQGVLSELGDKLGTDLDKLNPTTISNFLRKHDDFLRHFPELKAELSDYQRVAQNLTERLEQQQLYKKEANDSFLSMLLNTHVDNLPQTIANAIGTPTKFTQLKTWMSQSPQIRDSVLRHIAGDVMKHVMDTKGQTPLEFVRAHEPLLRQLFDTAGPTAFNNLEKVATAWTVHKRGGTAEAPTIPLTGGGLKAKTGTSVPSLTSLWRSMQEGRISKEYAATYVITRFLNRENEAIAQQVYERAMYDSDFAKTLNNMGEVAAKRGIDSTEAKEAVERFQNYARRVGIAVGVFLGSRGWESGEE